MRERCYECFRPVPLCFCQQIPRIENRTDVLMLQHVGERHHPFNTARMVRKALRQCELITEHNQRFGRHPLPIRANAGLLYPRVNAPLLTELPAGERPEQLVIIDGTWHQAKTILRDVAQLRDLPCYRLSPASPGRYRIRREPDAQSLSTLEATVAALRVLEPDTVGLDQLLSVFQRMVESQLEYPARQAAWRRKRTRRSRSRYLPDLPWNTEDLVVAYGEATPGRPGPRAATSSPVNWIAQRLGTGDRISCLLRQQSPLSRATLAHLRLTAEDFDVAVSQAEFRHLWSRFIRRGDILIV